jgi:hypothetical protein
MQNSVAKISFCSFYLFHLSKQKLLVHGLIQKNNILILALEDRPYLRLEVIIGRVELDSGSDGLGLIRVRMSRVIEIGSDWIKAESGQFIC